MQTVLFINILTKIGLSDLKSLQAPSNLYEYENRSWFEIEETTNFLFF